MSNPNRKETDDEILRKLDNIQRSLDRIERTNTLWCVWRRNPPFYYRISSPNANELPKIPSSWLRNEFE